ncbi:MAG: histidine kinase [Polaromonas sp.]
MTELDLAIAAIKTIQTHEEMAGGRFAALADFVKLADVLRHAGLDIVDRMRMHPGSLAAQPQDDFLTDTQGTSQQVSMLVPPLDRADSALPAMILLVPEKKRTALHHAVASTGTTHDCFENFLLFTQEAERKKIADDLHDGLGQLLVALKLRLEDALIRLDADKAAETKCILKDVVVQLRGAVGEVRRISTELCPALLNDLGL